MMRNLIPFCHSQVKWLAQKGARVFLAVIRPVESDSIPPVCNVGHASSLLRQGSQGGIMDAFTDMLAV
jgi:hypothetical protein